MTELVAKEGYAQASIAQTISLARVSRSTFYEHFEDKLDCFLAVERELGSRAFRAAEQAVRKCDTENVTHTVLRTLVEIVESDPAGTRVILTESLAAGPRAMDERDDFVARVGKLVEDSWARPSTESPVLDISPRALVGGACRLLSIRIMRGASGVHGLLPDLLVWVDSYSRTGEQPMWQTLDRQRWEPLPRSPYSEMPPYSPPARLPPGRHGLPAAYVSSNQRERILATTIAMLLKKGFVATTVADIVAEAQLTRAVFYQQFRNKRELLTEINQIHFQQMMAVSARAFFSAESWPERMWAAIHAAGEWNADNPAASHIGFIETHAVGSEFTRRIVEIVMAFAVFLEEGYRYRPEAETLPRISSDAIAATLCELMYSETRCGRATLFRDLIPHVAYLALAPFMGPQQAEAFIELKLRESAPLAGTRPPSVPATTNAE
jgi:AcrR family transcriptional regulator